MAFTFFFPDRDDSDPTTVSVNLEAAEPAIRGEDINQAIAYTGGLVPRVQILGDNTKFIRIRTAWLTDSDYNDLYDFFNDDLNWSVNTCDITDHFGVEYDSVRLIQGEWRFSTFLTLHRGTILMKVDPT